MASPEIERRWRNTETYRRERESIAERSSPYITNCERALTNAAANDEDAEWNQVEARRNKIRALACRDELQERGGE